MNNLTDADKRRAEELYPHEVPIDKIFVYEFGRKAYLLACSEKNEEMEREAIEFTEFCQKHAYKIQSNVSWHFKLSSPYYPDDHKSSSTAELYTLYKQQNAK